MRWIVAWAVWLPLASSAAFGDVSAPLPIAKENQAERSGERFAISTVTRQNGWVRISVGVRPAGDEQFVRADVEVIDQGKTVLRVPVVAAASGEMHSVQFTASPEMAAKCHLDVLLDVVGKNQTAVGQLYRIEVKSYLEAD